MVELMPVLAAVVAELASDDTRIKVAGLPPRARADTLEHVASVVAKEHGFAEIRPCLAKIAKASFSVSDKEVATLFQKATQIVQLLISGSLDATTHSKELVKLAATLKVRAADVLTSGARRERFEAAGSTAALLSPPTVAEQTARRTAMLERIAARTKDLGSSRKAREERGGNPDKMASEARQRLEARSAKRSCMQDDATGVGIDFTHHASTDHEAAATAPPFASPPLPLLPMLQSEMTNSAEDADDANPNGVEGENASTEAPTVAAPGGDSAQVVGSARQSSVERLEMQAAAPPKPSKARPGRDNTRLKRASAAQAAKPAKLVSAEKRRRIAKAIWRYARDMAVLETSRQKAIQDMLTYHMKRKEEIEQNAKVRPSHEPWGVMLSCTLQIAHQPPHDGPRPLVLCES